MRSIEIYTTDLPIPYHKAWELQRTLVAERKENRIPDTLLILEHEPVITLGRNAGTASLLFDEPTLRSKGVSLVVSDRGGDATYHVPGQIVANPIID